MEDLETVTSLSGVKSLPGEKDGKMVNVPLELIGKPASDAAARAEAAAKKSGRSRSRTGGRDHHREAATKANEAAAKAENAAAKVEQTTAAAVGGATARFSSWMEAGERFT